MSKSQTEKKELAEKPGKAENRENAESAERAGKPRSAAETAARDVESEAEMEPRPRAVDWTYRPAGKLAGKAALITGGDSGIGRAAAVLYAKEGADVAIVYLRQHEDASETRRMVEAEGRTCLALAGDVGDEAFCRKAVEEAVKAFGRLDILVNNAAEQHPREDIGEISAGQLERTFRTNIFGCFFMTQAALPHLRRQKGSSIINTSSVTAYRGNDQLLDYSATKGAIVAYTRALSKSLAKEGIRVNGVAPGPIWTPLITSTFPPEKAESFGKNVPLGRPGQPEEVAPCYVFLASDEASYITGQFLHPNGGEIVNA
jgi:NAD(P)-dependent dehydrogenase (short-subunit alcohol dehydrogenase family)